MNIIWSEEKNDKIKAREGGNGVGFEEAEQAIIDGKIVASEKNDNPTYADQDTIIVMVNNYPHKVPYKIIDENTIYLITMYPYRKFISKTS